MKYLYALDVSMTNTGVAIFKYPSGKFVHKCSISPNVDKSGNKNDYDGESLWFHYNKINELISKFRRIIQNICNWRGTFISKP